MLYDGVGIVILDPNVFEWGATLLCRRHADALRAPKGWTIEDRRPKAPTLFPVERFAVPEIPAHAAAEPGISSPADESTVEGTVGAIIEAPVDSPINLGDTRAAKQARRQLQRAPRLITHVAHATDTHHNRHPSGNSGELGDTPGESHEIQIHPDQSCFELPDTLATPLLARAFDKAAERTRPSVAIDALIPIGTEHLSPTTAAG